MALKLTCQRKLHCAKRPEPGSNQDFLITNLSRSKKKLNHAGFPSHLKYDRVDRNTCIEAVTLLKCNIKISIFKKNQRVKGDYFAGAS